MSKRSLYDCMLIRPEYLGAEGLLMPFLQHTSSQRAEMFSSHISQAIVLNDAELPKIASGFEGVIGQYQFGSEKLNENICIYASINSFKQSLITRGVNPEVYVIYVGEESGEFGYMKLENYTKSSQSFGYKNIWQGSHLRHKDSFIPKDENVSFSHPPNQEDDVWKYGTNLNVMYCTEWGVTEDACRLSEAAVDKLSYTAVETKKIKIGKDQIPLNLYGDEESYKVFPDINEHVRNDGILVGIRDVSDPALFIYDYTDHAMSPQVYDDLFKVPSNAFVTNISVHIGMRPGEGSANELVYEQIYQYQKQQIDFYLSLLTSYYDLVEQGYTPTDNMRNLVEYALRMLHAENSRSRISLSNLPNQTRKFLIDDFKRLGGKRVKLVDKKEDVEGIILEITYAYKVKPKRGHKLTGRDGAKGVIADIVPQDEMGYDEQGHPVELQVSCQGVMNRMNTGQNIEHFLTRACMDVESIIRNTVNDYSAYNTLLDFLNDIWPEYAQMVDDEYGKSDETKAEAVEYVRENGIQLVLPPYLDVDYEEMSQRLTDKWNIQKSHVTFRKKDANGNYSTIKTKEKVLIGKKYMLHLCKVPYLDESGVELAYLSQFEIPTKPGDKQKAMDVIKKTPIRFGEDEIALLVMSLGGEETARFMALNAGLSLEGIETLSQQLLTEEYPTQLERCGVSTERLISTNVQAKMMHHMAGCMGIEIEK